MHLVMRYLCFFGIVKRQGVKRRMDKRSTSEEQKSGYLGLTKADEERHLADVISVAQQNLERAGAAHFLNEPFQPVGVVLFQFCVFCF